MKFRLINNVDREALLEWPVWGQYYQPGDIDSLAECGYDKDLVRSSIEATGWSDDYWFPVPDGTAVGKFTFEIRRAYFRHRKGNEFFGYVFNQGHAIGLFGHEDVWIINSNVLDWFDEDLPRALLDLGLQPNDKLLPVEYCLPELGGRRSFPDGGPQNDPAPVQATEN